MAIGVMIFMVMGVMISMATMMRSLVVWKI
jgi:hypothetical protein